MSIRRIILFLLVSIAFVVATGTPTKLQENPGPDIIPGINVNMGSGIILPGGNLWHQQQNGPYSAISKLNSLLLLTSADNPPTGSPVNVDGFVQDPVTGVVEPAYAIQGITYTQDDVTGEFAGYLFTAEDENNYYFGFAQSVFINDNTYGDNAIGWESRKKGHRLKDLLNSDHIEVRLYDGSGNLALDFFLDYATQDRKTSEILNLGATGGDGAMVYGDPTYILESSSSLVWNFNQAYPSFPFKNDTNPLRVPTNTYDSWTTADPNYPWIYELVYEWSISKAAFPDGTLGNIQILEVHNSPSKKYDSVVPVPVITVKKEANPASGSYVVRDETILYSISVTNVGMAPITDVVITDIIDLNLDNIIPEDGGTYDEPSRTITWPSVPFLGPGDSILVQYWADVEPIDLPLPGPLDIFNFATISSPDLPTDINTNTTVHTVIPTPLIDIEKTPDYQEVLTGSTVTFTITVTNTGDVDLTGVAVTDPNIPDCSNLQIGTLAAGQSTSYECMVTVFEDIINVATVTGTPPVGPDVTDSDDAQVVVINPAIQIVKTSDATGSNQIGDLITYTFEVSNIGDVTLTNVTVLDSLYGSIDIFQTTLNPGEVTSGTAQHIVTQADIDSGLRHNVATATGNPPIGDPVTDTDDETVTFPQNPAIQVVKTSDATGSNQVGDVITFTYEVTNTGDVTLTNVSVTDDLEGPISLAKTTLIPGEATSGTAQYTVTQADIDAGSRQNVATATGNPPIGDPVTDTDDETVTFPQNPAIQVVKTSNATGSNQVRDVITFTYEVTNTGDVTLTNVSVTDDLEGPISLAKTTLTPGEVTTGTAQHTVTQDDIDAGSRQNVATAAGNPPIGDPVTDTDDETVTFPQNPSIQIEKTPDQQIVIGVGIATFNITVTNSGNVTLTDVNISDPLAPNCDNNTIGTLAPGASTSYPCTAVVTASIQNVATVTGTPPVGPDVTDNDDASVTVISPNIDIEKFTMVQVLPSNTCSTFGKPQVLTMLYTGDGPEATSHSQDAGKVSVEGDPNDANPVYITVANKENLSDSKTKIYLQDFEVALDDTFEIDANVVGKAQLEATTYVFVKDQAGNLLQTVMFHTSCSQPLNLGDQFGSIQLVGFLGESGEGDTYSEPQPGYFGEDADNPEGPTASAGDDTIIWTYIVTGSGVDIPLSNITVTDDNGTPSDPSDDFSPEPIEENGFNVGDTDMDGLLDGNETWLFRASRFAELGQYGNIATVEGTTPWSQTVSDQDPSHYKGVLSTSDQCADSKAKVLTMLYTGDGPEATSHSQDAGKVSVEGDPNGASPVYITVANKENLSDSKTKIYLQDFEISLSETFDIDATVVGKTRLEATTYVFVKDEDGNLLQLVMFHTSCSQPLILGDQFGSIQLVGFISE